MTKPQSKARVHYLTQAWGIILKNYHYCLRKCTRCVRDTRARTRMTFPEPSQTHTLYRSHKLSHVSTGSTRVSVTFKFGKTRQRKAFSRYSNALLMLGHIYSVSVVQWVYL